MNKLSPSDELLSKLYYDDKLTQAACASHFKVSTPAINARLDRLDRRVQLIKQLPTVNWENVYILVKGRKSEKFVNVLRTFIKTGSQSRTAGIIGKQYKKRFPQPQVRAMLFTAMAILDELSQLKAKEYVKLLINSRGLMCAREKRK